MAENEPILADLVESAEHPWRDRVVLWLRMAILALAAYLAVRDSG